MSGDNNEGPSNRPACASCKQHRKKCYIGCPMAPHFPPERKEEFDALFKVFGLSNTKKMLQGLNSLEEEKEVVESLIWEGFMWKQDRVHGPFGQYKKLEEKLNLLIKQDRDNQQQVILEPPVAAGWYSNGANYSHGNGSVNNYSTSHDGFQFQVGGKEGHTHIVPYHANIGQGQERVSQGRGFQAANFVQEEERESRGRDGHIAPYIYHHAIAQDRMINQVRGGFQAAHHDATNFVQEQERERRDRDHGHTVLYHHAIAQAQDRMISRGRGRQERGGLAMYNNGASCSYSGQGRGGCKRSFASIDPSSAAHGHGVQLPPMMMNQGRDGITVATYSSAIEPSTNGFGVGREGYLASVHPLLQRQEGLISLRRDDLPAVRQQHLMMNTAQNNNIPDQFHRVNVQTVLEDSTWPEN